MKVNVILLFALKAISAASAFLMVPASLHYLDSLQYGIWVTLAAVLGWISFFDIGLGSSLRNKFAETLTKGQTELGREYVSTVYTFLGVSVCAVLLAFLLTYRLFDWVAILNAPPGMSEELKFLALVVVSLFLGRLVVGLIGMLLLADQRPASNSLIDVLTNVISLGAVFVLARTTHGSLVLLGISVSLVYFFVPFGFTIGLFRTRYKPFAPSFRLYRHTHLRELAAVGLQFFLLQIAYVINYLSSNVIISQVFGPIEVTRYNIAFRYYSVPLLVSSTLLLPFWSAYTEAYHREDWEWIGKSLRKLMTLWVFGVVGVAVVTYFAGDIYRLWIGDSILIPTSLSVLMAIYVLEMAWANIFAMFLNGVGKIRLQTYVGVVSATLTIPLALFCCRNMGIGSGGVVLAGCLGLLPLCLLWPLQTYKILRGRADGIWGK